MTDAIYVRRLPHLELPRGDAAGPAIAPAGSGASASQSHPQGEAAAPAQVVCRSIRVRVNLGRLLADLDIEARRLLGGAMCE